MNFSFHPEAGNEKKGTKKRGRGFNFLLLVQFLKKESGFIMFEYVERKK
jgi:hypothetical protein